MVQRFTAGIRGACTAVLFATLAAAVVLAGRGQTRVPAQTSADPQLKGLAYRMIGPHRGGRSTAVAGIPGDHRTFYMGATGGGVWKTIDAGDVWENVSDPFFDAGSVGAIAVAPSDPRVVYVGTGSACIRNNVRSASAPTRPRRGRHVAADRTRRRRADRADPRRSRPMPSLVYVAVLGHAFGPNATRGVFRSKDGGQHWDKVLFVNDRTGAADLAMDAKNPTRALCRALDGRASAVGSRRRLERRRRLQDDRRRRPLDQADARAARWTARAALA